MSRKCKFSIEDILPHREPMIWLSNVVSYEDGFVECEVSHSSTSPFTDEYGRRPSWVGIEYVCQAILALEGISRLEDGKRAVPGFILGAKRIEFTRAYFEANETMLVRVETQVTVDSTFGAYSGELFIRGERVMQSIVKGVLVEDPASIWNA